jgi:hypothetical protein
VPIPFHDIDDVDELGSAGFIKLELVVGGDVRMTSGAMASLLVINPRGEPLEFAFNRSAIPRCGASAWRATTFSGAWSRRCSACAATIRGYSCV